MTHFDIHIDSDIGLCVPVTVTHRDATRNNRTGACSPLRRYVSNVGPVWTRENCGVGSSVTRA